MIKEISGQVFFNTYLKYDCTKYDKVDGFMISKYYDKYGNIFYNAIELKTMNETFYIQEKEYNYNDNLKNKRLNYGYDD